MEDRKINKKKDRKPKIRVVLGCCEALSELVLHNILQSESEIEIIKTAETLHELLDLTKSKMIDIVIICYSNLKEMGIDLISKIKNNNNHVKFIVLCGSFTIEQELMLLRKGVNGIISTKQILHFLVEAVRNVYSGGYWIRREVLNALAESGKVTYDPVEPTGKFQQLTKREKEVLALISIGCSNLEISSQLFVSESTVKTHISHIYKKLNINNRLEAAIFSKKNS